MYEKVNPAHPDKVADRIGGAIVDLAYSKQKNPKIAVEVLIGHGDCSIIIESSIILARADIQAIVDRIAGQGYSLRLKQVEQDIHLATNQKDKIRCGDNGIFKGVPVTEEQRELAQIAKRIYDLYPYDGKYILDKKNDKLIICQSHAKTEDLQKLYPNAIINPLGDWTGSPSVDSGLTGRKLGSDMGDSVSGGSIIAKDLSKADVSVNIYAWLKAQETEQPVELCCAIGDEYVDGRPYSEIVEIARKYIESVGGFEKFAEQGLIRTEEV